MVRFRGIALAAVAFSSLASAQRGAPNSAPPTPPPPNPLRDADRAAGDPITRIRADSELDKKRYERAVGTSDDLGHARPAKPQEVQAGQPVNDPKGVLIGIVEKVEQDGVIVTVGTSHIKVPADAFGINKKGLLLQVMKEQFDQLAAQSK